MNKHWSLFLADSKKKLGTKLVYYLDSLQASCFDKKVALRKWMDFIKIRKDYSGDEWELGLFSHAKQTYGFNCGVICLKFLEILIQRATDKGDDKVDMAITFNDKSLHEYREYLLSQIIKNSKN